MEQRAAQLHLGLAMGLSAGTTGAEKPAGKFHCQAWATGGVCGAPEPPPQAASSAAADRNAAAAIGFFFWIFWLIRGPWLVYS